MIKVSIIVPNYNHELFLAKRINSILNQTFQDFELIILDDCSTDNSLELLSPMKNHPKTSHFICNEKNSGSAIKQWKKGIELAKGQWIWIAESDDYCAFNFLETLINESKKSENCDLIYCQSFEVDKDDNIKRSLIEYTSNIPDNPFRRDFTMCGENFIEYGLKYQNVVPNASAVICKRTIIAEAINDTKLLSMKMAADWLIWVKISQKTSVRYLEKHMNYFRSHSASTRIHNTVEKRKLRLWEEKIVRDEITKFNAAIDQSIQISRLHNLWYDFHSLRFLFRPNFWAFKIRNFSYFKYAVNFIRYNKKYR